MVVLHGAGDDTARTYYGTDTRAAAVLAGAALAAWGTRRAAYSRVTSVLGAIAAIGLGVAWFTVDGASAGLYEGGFALCAIAGAAVIAAASGGGLLARLLSVRPLGHLGRISYGVYLWHWPTFVVLDSRTTIDGWPLLVAKLAVTLAISELSFHLLELPIRRGALSGWRIRVAAPAAGALAVLAVVAGTGAPVPASAAAPAPPPLPPTTATTVVGTTRVLVVGDSGAAYLGDGLARVGASRDVEVRNAGTISCGLVTDGGRLRLDGGGYVPDPDWCAAWPDRWRMEAAAFEPDIALLVIAWPGLGDRRVDGAWRHPCDPRFDARYASVVREAIDVLGSTGARVVVADSPYLTLPVVQADHAARVDCLNAVYREVAASAGATVLPIGEWLCDSATDCAIERRGTILRSDGIHFRDGGADIAARWAIGELLSPRRGG
jgi:hypothetical protein